MKNEASINNSKQIANNSSLLTAENSSKNSKLIMKRNLLRNAYNQKFTNMALFEIPRRKLPKTNNNSRKKNGNGIYITDLTISKFRDTGFETRTTQETLNSNYRTQNKLSKIKKKSYKNSKNSLPNIKTGFSKQNSNPFYSTCCNRKSNMKHLTMLYNEPWLNSEEDNDKRNNGQKIVRDDKKEFLKKTNEIKRLKYEVELKKEAIEEYKENIKLQKNSIEHTISNLQTYKDNLENHFLTKYNIDLRKFEKELLLLKLSNDRDNNEINNLNKEISSLQYLLIKKENIIKDIEKWIKLQIYIKEGEEPHNLNIALKKYENTFIFNSLEDLNNTLTMKENKNLRLMEKYNKIQKDKQYYIEELQQLEKEVKNSDKSIYTLMSQKEHILNSLKSRQSILNSTINSLTYSNTRNTITTRNKTYTRCKSSKIKTHSHIYNEELKKNDLGILYKPITIKNDIIFSIDCIYISIIKNNIKGLKLDSNLLTQANNINVSKNKRAVAKMEIIEISLNYLISSIKDMIKSDKNNVIIMEKTLKLIDLYHKKINGNKNKEEVKKNWNNLMKKIEEKNKKNYFLPRGKIEKYNIVSIQRNKNHIYTKNKQFEKKIGIWDFLYDQNDDVINANKEQLDE